MFPGEGKPGPVALKWTNEKEKKEMTVRLTPSLGLVCASATDTRVCN